MTNTQTDDIGRDLQAMGPINPESVLGQIAARLKAIEHIEITDDTDWQKHYGYKIGVGNNTLSALWHCTDDRTHPDHARYAAEGGDVADLYCDSHYPTVDDDAMLAFLLNAKQDIASLLNLIRQQAAQLAEAQAGGWISVRERLPEKTPVLISTKYGEQFVGAFYGPELGWNLLHTVLPAGGVTHWRPLPAPPAQEVGDE